MDTLCVWLTSPSSEQGIGDHPQHSLQNALHRGNWCVGRRPGLADLSGCLDIDGRIGFFGEPPVHLASLLLCAHLPISSNLGTQLTSVTFLLRVCKVSHPLKLHFQ